jgi:hypothetical protein
MPPPNAKSPPVHAAALSMPRPPKSSATEDKFVPAGAPGNAAGAPLGWKRRRARRKPISPSLGRPAGARDPDAPPPGPWCGADGA